MPIPKMGPSSPLFQILGVYWGPGKEQAAGSPKAGAENTLQIPSKKEDFIRKR